MVVRALIYNGTLHATVAGVAMGLIPLSARPRWEGAERGRGRCGALTDWWAAASRSEDAVTVLRAYSPHMRYFLRCDWCGVSLPPQHGRRYCRAAHRQAAWRARRRWQEAATGREGVAAAGEDLALQLQAITQHVQQQPWPGLPAGFHCAAVACVPELAGQLVRAAVLADRQAGASWSQIGAGLGISAEAARSRFGRIRQTTTPTASRAG